jgi:flagellar assembly protein FliH
MSSVIDKTGDGHFQRWDIPDLVSHGGADSIQGGDHQARQRTARLSPGSIERLHREAYEEGFALGKKEGEAIGRQELVAQAGRLEQLMSALAAPFERLDDEVEEKLVALSMAVAGQLVRREIKTDPQQIVAVVREAVTALPESGRSIHLHLHPEDAGLVRQLVPMPEGENPWSIVEDPTISRGGCQVTTNISRVDATLEARLNAVIAAVMGGEREGDGL